MKLKTLPIFLAFLCMGFGDAVNSFVGKAKAHFELSNFEAQFVAFAGFIMFGILSIPMGVIQDRIGRKKTLLIGLAVAFLGVLTVMIAGVKDFYVFLSTILLLGAGATVLQVSGNPIMRDVSDEGAYSSNLSLGQSIKAIGSFTAPVFFFLAAKFGLSEDDSWTYLFPIFAVAIGLSFVSVLGLKIDEKKSESKAPSIFSCIALLANPYVLLMTLGIFLYVGAEACVANGMPIYFNQKFAVDPGIANQYIIYFYVAIMVARFAGAGILRIMSPKKFLILTSILTLLGFAMLLPEQKMLSTVALFVIALGYANVFPLIFSMAIDRMPSKSNELSGLMITAIVGGAFVPLLMGKVADMTSNLMGFAVPFACVIYILLLALFARTSRIENS